MAKNQNLITAKDAFDDLNNPFKSERDRIKYMSKAYKGISVTKSFDIFYDLGLSNEAKSSHNFNNVANIEVGKIYTGNVVNFDKNTLEFDIPGVKEEIICKESFGTCIEAVNDYLLTHDNKLMFEVREYKNGQYIVSVLNAYYKSWVNMINKAVEREDSIQVHIDSLIRGGYLCHTNITPLCELTGKNYTSNVFIPGSHIVLNIEHDFEKWVGQDVIIVPQKLVEFRRDMRAGLIENSLVGSRKRVLQIMGVYNMAKIYNDMDARTKLAEKTGGTVTPDKYEGTVTGIINSNKNTGIFIELDDLYITGLMPIPQSSLLDYKPGDKVSVIIKQFEVQEGKDPFVYNRRKQIVKCNVRPVFEMA